jgi:hypothetical protein
MRGAFGFGLPLLRHLLLAVCVTLLIMIGLPAMLAMAAAAHS